MFNPMDGPQENCPIRGGLDHGPSAGVYSHKFRTRLRRKSAIRLCLPAAPDNPASPPASLFTRFRKQIRDFCGDHDGFNALVCLRKGDLKI